MPALRDEAVFCFLRSGCFPSHLLGKSHYFSHDLGIALREMVFESIYFSLLCCLAPNDCDNLSTNLQRFVFDNVTLMRYQVLFSALEGLPSTKRRKQDLAQSLSHYCLLGKHLNLLQ